MEAGRESRKPAKTTRAAIRCARAHRKWNNHARRFFRKTAGPTLAFLSRAFFTLIMPNYSQLPVWMSVISVVGKAFFVICPTFSRIKIVGKEARVEVISFQARRGEAKRKMAQSKKPQFWFTRSHSSRSLSLPHLSLYLFNLSSFLPFIFLSISLVFSVFASRAHHSTPFINAWYCSWVVWLDVNAMSSGFPHMKNRPYYLTLR